MATGCGFTSDPEKRTQTIFVRTRGSVHGTEIDVDTGHNQVVHVAIGAVDQKQVDLPDKRVIDRTDLALLRFIPRRTGEFLFKGGDDELAAALLAPVVFFDSEGAEVQLPPHLAKYNAELKASFGDTRPQPSSDTSASLFADRPIALDAVRSRLDLQAMMLLKMSHAWHCTATLPSMLSFVDGTELLLPLMKIAAENLKAAVDALLKGHNSTQLQSEVTAAIGKIKDFFEGAVDRLSTASVLCLFVSDTASSGVGQRSVLVAFENDQTAFGHIPVASQAWNVVLTTNLSTSQTWAERRDVEFRALLKEIKAGELSDEMRTRLSAYVSISNAETLPGLSTKWSNVVVGGNADALQLIRTFEPDTAELHVSRMLATVASGTGIVTFCSMTARNVGKTSNRNSFSREKVFEQVAELIDRLGDGLSFEDRLCFRNLHGIAGELGGLVDSKDGRQLQVLRLVHKGRSVEVLVPETFIETCLPEFVKNTFELPFIAVVTKDETRHSHCGTVGLPVMFKNLGSRVWVIDAVVARAVQFGLIQ